VELRFPSAVLNPQRQYPTVGKETPDNRVVMRLTEANHSGPIYPGDTKELLAVDYLMTHDLYDRRGRLFPLLAEAFFYADGRTLASTSRKFKDLQWF
jgi:hypothetical protein